MPDCIRDQSHDRRYFITLPNLVDDSDLDPFECRLLLHYKRVCGDEGTCYQSLTTTASICHIRRATVIAARDRLVAKGWITVSKEKTPVGLATVVTIIDRWLENTQRYACTNGHTGTDGNGRWYGSATTPGTDGILKEEPIEEKRSKKNVPYGAATPPASAAEVYQQTVTRLSNGAKVNEQVAALMDFAQVIRPDMAKGGRIAALIKRHSAIGVLNAMWDAAPKPLAGDPLNYVEATLKHHGERGLPPPSASADLGWEKASRQGRGHPEGEA